MALGVLPLMAVCGCQDGMGSFLANFSATDDRGFKVPSRIGIHFPGKSLGGCGTLAPANLSHFGKHTLAYFEARYSIL